MKRFKAKKTNKSKEKKLIQKASYESVEFLTTMVEAILRDDFKFNNKEVNKFKDSMNRYCGYVANNSVSFQEIKQIIERKKKNEDKGE